MADSITTAPTEKEEVEEARDVQNQIANAL
jgi:hypothetical protein